MTEQEDIRTIEFYIRNIAHALSYVNDQELSRYDITNQQGRLLGAIYYNFSNRAVNRKFLQEKMGLNGSSVTSLLNSLEKKGYIIRSTNKEDSRALMIKVTPKGEKIVKEVTTYLHNTEEAMISEMTENEVAMFRRLLKKSYDKILDLKKDE